MVDPTIKLYDAVRIKVLCRPLGVVPECFNTQEPRVGDVAFVIEIYEDPPGYELECSGEDGITKWLLTFSPEEIELEKVPESLSDEALCNLLVSAFANFIAAGISVDRARFGLFGTWVGDQQHSPIHDSGAQLDKTLDSANTWPKVYPSFPNPYSDLSRFYRSGASLGRWENKILCVYGPDGRSLGGIPLESLITAASSRQ
jgi:hypothetical protein